MKCWYLELEPWSFSFVDMSGFTFWFRLPTGSFSTQSQKTLGCSLKKMKKMILLALVKASGKVNYRP
jgi:hypothetical protein